MPWRVIAEKTNNNLSLEDSQQPPRTTLQFDSGPVSKSLHKDKDIALVGASYKRRWKDNESDVLGNQLADIIDSRVQFALSPVRHTSARVNYHCVLRKSLQ